MAQSPDAPLDRPRVCIAVQSDAIRTHVTELLREDGCDTVCYTSAALMLELDDQGKPSARQMARIADCELVIAELEMVGLSGLDAARLLKADSRTESIPVLLITKATTDTLVYEGVQAGVVDFVTTPLDVRSFLDRVNRALHRAGYAYSPRRAEPLVIELGDYLRKEVCRADRAGVPLSLVYARVEEQQGAGRGGVSLRRGTLERKREELLETAVHEVRRSLRESDTVARCGPLDFVAILPFTDIAGADIVTQRITASFGRATSRDALADRVIREMTLGTSSYPTVALDDQELLVFARDAARTGRLRSLARPGEDPLQSCATLCPVCATRFRRWWVPDSAVRPSGRDTDHMPVYTDVNPLLYEPIVCPGCFYSGYADDFLRIPHTARRQIVASKRLLSAVAAGHSFDGKRNVTVAAHAHLLAAECYKRRAAPPGRVATAFHHAAWMFRLLKDQARETLLLREALRFYVNAEREQDYRGLEMDRANLLYVAGDICQRLGDSGHAAKLFAHAHQVAVEQQTLYHRMATAPDGLIHLARRRYQDLRAVIR